MTSCALLAAAAGAVGLASAVGAHRTRPRGAVGRTLRGLLAGLLAVAVWADVRLVAAAWTEHLVHLAP